MQVWRCSVVAAGMLSLGSCGGATQYWPNENEGNPYAGSKSHMPTRAIEQAPAPTLMSLLNSQQYNAAIKMLERDSRGYNTAEMRQQIAQTIKLAEAYDKGIGTDIEDAVNKQDWNVAYRLLDQAVTNYPQGAAAREWRSVLTPHQQGRIEELKTSLLIERAMWVLQSQGIVEEWISLEPSNPASATKLEELRTEAQNLATRLSKIGVAALTANDLDLADRSLSLADRLYPNAENILALERLDRAQHEMARGKRKQHSRVEQEQANRDVEKHKQSLQAGQERQQYQRRRLAEGINAAIGKGELLRAQAMLEQLRSAEKTHPQLAGLEQILMGLIATRVDALLEKGNTLYSNGEVEHAKTVWEEALLLSPSSTRVRARVARAQQVLNNLREQQKASN